MQKTANFNVKIFLLQCNNQKMTKNLLLNVAYSFKVCIKKDFLVPNEEKNNTC
jgi:hypothetical protein